MADTDVKPSDSSTSSGLDSEAKDQSSESVANPSQQGDDGNHADVDEGVMSIEALDKIIADEDPEFSAEMNAMKSDAIRNDDLDDSFVADYTLKVEKSFWKESVGITKYIYVVMPFLPYLIFPVKKTYRTIYFIVAHFPELSLRFLKAIPGWLLKKIKGFGRGLKKSVGEVGSSFKSFSKLQKLAAVFLFLFIGLSGYVGYRIISHKGLLPHEEPLFLSNFEEWADSSQVYEPGQEMESFYDSMHGVQNVLQMTKMVVNIKKSAGSGENPMAAFDFVIEGSASEAVVEVKDRESEMRDLFQRIIEEMNYDQLSTPEGKQMLCDRLRKKVNSVLSKGKIRRVYINTVIIKP